MFEIFLGDRHETGNLFPEGGQVAVVRTRVFGFVKLAKVVRLQPYDGLRVLGGQKAGGSGEFPDLALPDSSL